MRKIGIGVDALSGNIRLNPEALNSWPVVGASRTYEPELVCISSVHDQYPPGIPVSAILSPPRLNPSGVIFNIPNSGKMTIILVEEASVLQMQVR